ncbi:MAG TPA: trypsin-like peptidase domain-containing protein [Longimicrobiaceae bacterium]|nr:trypsin-like peptidase domain-containing protein [Longimicrobiaceae bacterium]
MVALVGLAMAPGTLPAQAPLSIPAIVRMAGDAVVTLHVYDQAGRRTTLGSGFFLPDGRIVTNLHVVRGGARVEVIGASGQLLGSIPFAEAVSEEADLALLPRLAGVRRHLPLAGARPQVGESVVVIGAPEGLSNTVSNGIVSAFRQVEGRPRMQISAPISPGSSGGPVLNGRGQVVGVSLSILEGGQNLNFAVPLEDVRAMLASPAGQLAFPGGATRLAKAAPDARRGEGASIPAPPAIQPLAAGGARGELATSDERLEDGSYYDLYAFTARAGEPVTVRMTSSAFESYLAWGRMSGGKFTQLGWADASGGDGASQLRITPPEDGVYVVRANSRRPAQTGAYALTLASESAVAAAPAN